MHDAHLTNWRPGGGTFLVLWAVALSAAPAQAQRVDGSFQRTVTVSAAASIEVVTGSGRIEVRPGPAGRVEIIGRVRADDGWGSRSRRLSADERVRRIEANPPIEQSGGTVRIGHIKDEEVRDGVSISFTLTVPPDVNLKSNSGSGSQDIGAISGNVEARSGSGGITAESVGGSFRASTGSGSIRATAVRGAIVAKSGSGGIDVTQVGSGDVDVSSSSGSVHLRGVRGAVRASTSSGRLTVEGQLAGDWRLSSSSGGIRVTLPRGQGFELDARSSSGRIETDFPVTITGMTERRALRGAAQGGGSLLHLRTSSGGIAIKGS